MYKQTPSNDWLMRVSSSALATTKAIGARWNNNEPSPPQINKSPNHLKIQLLKQKIKP